MTREKREPVVHGVTGACKRPMLRWVSDDSFDDDMWYSTCFVLSEGNTLFGERTASLVGSTSMAISSGNGWGFPADQINRVPENTSYDIDELIIWMTLRELRDA